MKSFWLSWYNPPGATFELHWPWWESGWRVPDDAATIVAAVRATDESTAKEIVYAAHDHRPPDIDARMEWRFVNERPDDWSPYCDRFPKGKWMPDWPPVGDPNARP